MPHPHKDQLDAITKESKNDGHCKAHPTCWQNAMDTICNTVLNTGIERYTSDARDALLAAAAGHADANLSKLLSADELARVPRWESVLPLMKTGLDFFSARLSGKEIPERTNLLNLIRQMGHAANPTN